MERGGVLYVIAGMIVALVLVVGLSIQQVHDKTTGLSVGISKAYGLTVEARNGG